jgi:hypothetical protein
LTLLACSGALVALIGRATRERDSRTSTLPEEDVKTFFFVVAVTALIVRVNDLTNSVAKQHGTLLLGVLLLALAARPVGGLLFGGYGAELAGQAALVAGVAGGPGCVSRWSGEG